MKTNELVKCIRQDYIDAAGNPSYLPFEIGESYRIERVDEIHQIR